MRGVGGFPPLRVPSVSSDGLASLILVLQHRSNTVQVPSAQVDSHMLTRCFVAVLCFSLADRTSRGPVRSIVLFVAPSGTSGQPPGPAFPGPFGLFDSGFFCFVVFSVIVVF